MLLRLLLAACMLSPCALQAQSVTERLAKDELVFASDDDPAMRRAFKQASDTLDDFLKKAAAPPAGTSAYALKVGVRDGSKLEYMCAFGVRSVFLPAKKQT